jgi:hypothetical protein
LKFGHGLSERMVFFFYLLVVTLDDVFIVESFILVAGTCSSLFSMVDVRIQDLHNRAVISSSYLNIYVNKKWIEAITASTQMDQHYCSYVTECRNELPIINRRFANAENTCCQCCADGQRREIHS